MQVVLWRQCQAIDQFHMTPSARSPASQIKPDQTPSLRYHDRKRQQPEDERDSDSLLREFHTFVSLRCLLFFDIEVGDSHRHLVLYQHYFPKSDQRPTDQDVDVLAR